MIALGVVILLNPFQSAQALITFIGICMLLDGVINLWNAFVVWQHLRVLKKPLPPPLIPSPPQWMPPMAMLPLMW